MSKKQVQLWYNRFNEDREDGNDDAHSSLPSISTTDENNRRISIIEFTDDVGILFGSCQAIFTHISGKRRAVA